MQTVSLTCRLLYFMMRWLSIIEHNNIISTPKVPQQLKNIYVSLVK